MLPFTVSRNCAPPDATEDGFKLLIAGTGVAIVNVSALEVPPPGAGLTTVTLAVPTLVMSTAEIEAVSWEVETKLVVRDAPFQRTSAPLTRPLPLTVRVNALRSAP